MNKDNYNEATEWLQSFNREAKDVMFEELEQAYYILVQRQDDETDEYDRVYVPKNLEANFN